ncbi:MAG: APC family permease [Chloroflexi bacterium]|nr:APC family permease [Chloroflexota bacterium]
MATSSASGELFVRRASGLTRTVSPWTALIYAFMAPTMSSTFVFMTQTGTVYPGTNLYFAGLAILLLLPVGGIYLFMSLSMPRSGGEYIYVSRILHPLLGFVSSWTITIVGLTWSGIQVSWFLNWGVGNLFLAEGHVLNNQTLVDWGKYFSLITDENRWVLWGIGTILLAITYFIMSRGTKAVMRVMWVAFAFCWLMLICFLIATLTAGPEQTIAGMEAAQGIKMADLTAKVSEMSGGSGLPLFSVLATLYGGLVFAQLGTLGTTYAANISGEIKRVNLAQPLAQIGAVGLCFAWWMMVSFGVNQGIGENLVRTISYLETQGEASSMLGTYPLVVYMVSWSSSNPFLVAFGGPLGLMIVGWAGSMLGLGFAPVRNLFAYSFDGLLPGWFNKVSRNGSPNNAVIAGFVVAWGTVTVSFFTTWFSYIVYSVTVWMVGWVILGIAAMVFPYVRRDIFEKSPAMVQSKLGGVPIISILGAAGFITSALTVYATFLVGDTPVLSVQSLAWTSAFFIALPIVIYVVAYFWQRSKGISMDLRFKTIPPD